MMNYNDYLELGFTELTEDNFNKYIVQAETILESLTRNVDVTINKWVYNKYLKALALEVEYLSQGGGSGVSQWSVGRSSVTTKSDTTQLINNNVILALSGTGLLYRGL